MGGAETVKEVDKWQPCLDGGQMGNTSHIHDLLYIGGCQKHDTCLPAGHNILMITENRESMGGNRPGGYMQHSGQKLA
jgi:hypothetical protein